VWDGADDRPYRIGSSSYTVAPDATAGYRRQNNQNGDDNNDDIDRPDGRGRSITTRRPRPRDVRVFHGIIHTYTITDDINHNIMYTHTHTHTRNN